MSLAKNLFPHFSDLGAASRRGRMLAIAVATLCRHVLTCRSWLRGASACLARVFESLVRSSTDETQRRSVAASLVVVVTDSAASRADRFRPKFPELLCTVSVPCKADAVHQQFLGLLSGSDRDHHRRPFGCAFSGWLAGFAARWDFSSSGNSYRVQSLLEAHSSSPRARYRCFGTPWTLTRCHCSGASMDTTAGSTCRIAVTRSSVYPGISMVLREPFSNKTDMAPVARVLSRVHHPEECWKPIPGQATVDGQDDFFSWCLWTIQASFSSKR